MNITRVPNRNSPPAVLLRESYRENGKVKSRTLANPSKFPTETIARELVLEALTKALERRRHPEQLLYYSAYSSQCACADVQALFKHHGSTASMGRKGNC
jgi:transposase InsO family protein